MAVILFGNGPELHDRLVGKAGDFAEVDAVLGEVDEVIVPARRSNAFHLGATVVYACRRRGVDYELETFDPHPVETIAQRFADHLVWLRNLGRRCRVRIAVDDPLLLPLLEHIAEQADGTNETELLRLLGIVCDTPLVGPHWFVFEVINSCNARCSYCNIHAPNRKPGRDFLDQKLSFEQYTATVNSLARMGTDGVTILANGEPTLHPDFARMVHYAKSCGLRVNFFTNGLLLDEDVARVIVDNHADEMFCTISAADAATYAALHADADERDWENLLANLRRLFALRDQAGTGLPTAWMVNVICHPNAGQLFEMAELAVALGFNGLRPQLLRVDEYNKHVALNNDDLAHLQKTLPELQKHCEKLRVKLWDGYVFQLSRAGDDPADWSGDEFVDRGCFIGWGLGLAKSDGDLSFCCTVKPVANLREGPFEKLWREGLYQQARLAAKDLRHAGDLKMRDGEPLYTDYCHHCDNHDINHRLHEGLTRYDLWRFLA